MQEVGSSYEYEIMEEEVVVIMKPEKEGRGNDLIQRKRLAEVDWTEANLQSLKSETTQSFQTMTTKEPLAQSDFRWEETAREEEAMRTKVDPEVEEERKLKEVRRAKEGMEYLRNKLEEAERTEAELKSVKSKMADAETSFRASVDLVNSISAEVKEWESRVRKAEKRVESTYANTAERDSMGEGKGWAQENALGVLRAESEKMVEAKVLLVVEQVEAEILKLKLQEHRRRCEELGELFKLQSQEPLTPLDAPREEMIKEEGEATRSKPNIKLEKKKFEDRRRAKTKMEFQTEAGLIAMKPKEECDAEDLEQAEWIESELELLKSEIADLGMSFKASVKMAQSIQAEVNGHEEKVRIAEEHARFTNANMKKGGILSRNKNDKKEAHENALEVLKAENEKLDERKDQLFSTRDKAGVFKLQLKECGRRLESLESKILAEAEIIFRGIPLNIHIFPPKEAEEPLLAPFCEPPQKEVREEKGAMCVGANLELQERRLKGANGAREEMECEQIKPEEVEPVELTRAEIESFKMKMAEVEMSFKASVKLVKSISSEVEERESRARKAEEYAKSAESNMKKGGILGKFKNKKCKKDAYENALDALRAENEKVKEAKDRFLAARLRAGNLKLKLLDYRRRCEGLEADLYDRLAMPSPHMPGLMPL